MNNMSAEIILIGNELLIGKVKDTNGSYLIDELLKYGIKINRMTIIPDDIEVIAEEIKSAIDRKPLLIFTSGGLGPTYDDMTLEGIAKALGVELNLNNEALEQVKERYRKLKQIGRVKTEDLTESKLKMAKIPINSIPLKNNAGAAPGILININHDKGLTKLISMPGFPDELKSIFNDHVVPILKQLHANYYHAGLKFLNVGESDIAPDLIELRARYPQIWIKTHPVKDNTSIIKNEIHLTMFLVDVEESNKSKLINDIIELRETLKNRIEKLGGEVIEIY